MNAWNNPASAQPFNPGQGPGNYAYATGAYGPNGIHQTAGVNPPNKVKEVPKNETLLNRVQFTKISFLFFRFPKNKPNIDTRFAADDANPGGFFGVSTSSFSSSSNVNGQEQHKEGAITSVNDNGKVTTYQAGN